MIDFVEKVIDTCREVFGLRHDQQFSPTQLLDVKAVAIGHLKLGYMRATLMTNDPLDPDVLLTEARRHTRIAQAEQHEKVHMVTVTPKTATQGTVPKDQGEGEGTPQTPSEGKPR